MKLVLPNADLNGSSWRRLFADTLIRLRPEMNPDAADELSDSAFLSFGELDPCSAAERYCQDRSQVPSAGIEAQSRRSGRAG